MRHQRDARERLAAFDADERGRIVDRAGLQGGGRIDGLADQRRQPLAPAGGAGQQDEQTRVGLRGQPLLAPLRDALQLFTLIRRPITMRGGATARGIHRGRIGVSSCPRCDARGDERLQARRGRGKAREDDRPLVARRRAESRGPRPTALQPRRRNVA